MGTIFFLCPPVLFIFQNRDILVEKIDFFYFKGQRFLHEMIITMICNIFLSFILNFFFHPILIYFIFFFFFLEIINLFFFFKFLKIHPSKFTNYLFFVSRNNLARYLPDFVHTYSCVQPAHINVNNRIIIVISRKLGEFS